MINKNEAIDAIATIPGVYRIRSDLYGGAIAYYGKMEVTGIEFYIIATQKSLYDLNVEGRIVVTDATLDCCIKYLHDNLPEVVARKLADDFAIAIGRLMGKCVMGDAETLANSQGTPRALRSYARVSIDDQVPLWLTVDTYMNGSKIVIDGEVFHTVKEAAWHVRKLTKPVSAVACPV